MSIHPSFSTQSDGNQRHFDYDLIKVTFNCSGEVNLMEAFNFIGTFTSLVFQVFLLAVLILNFLQVWHIGVSSGICVNFITHVLAQWASDVEWTSIWCPSVHQKYGTSEGRPNSVHYGCPLDTSKGRPTDAPHLWPIQRRHVCKFISWMIASFIYFKVLCAKNFKYFFLSLKMRLLKRCQRMPEEAGKRTNQIFGSILIWTNQFPVSFTAFFEKMPEVRIFL